MKQSPAKVKEDKKQIKTYMSAIKTHLELTAVSKEFIKFYTNKKKSGMAIDKIKNEFKELMKAIQLIEQTEKAYAELLTKRQAKQLKDWSHQISKRAEYLKSILNVLKIQERIKQRG